MTHIIKLGLILLIECNLFYLLGFLMNKIKYLPEQESVVGKFVSGFIGYHFLFWCVSFPQSILVGKLDCLTKTWLIVLILIIVLASIFFRKELFDSYKAILVTSWKYRLYVIPCSCVLIFFIYYVCVNGQNDIDARVYIGDVTTILDTNKLVGINTSLGVELDVIPYRRAFTMFEENSAVMCDIFNVRPLLYCRTVRAIENIILFFSATFLILKFIYRMREDVIEHSIIVSMLAISMLFLLSNSIYTSSSFILHRAYEGKAYTSGTLVLISIYMCIMLCHTNDDKFFWMILFTMIASMSISATAILVTPVIVVSIVLAYIIIEKKWKWFLKLLFAISPNIVYFLVSLLGVTVIYLEG